MKKGTMYRAPTGGIGPRCQSTEHRRRTGNLEAKKTSVQIQGLEERNGQRKTHCGHATDLGGVEQ
jgi:hypothetical protein